MDTQQFQKFLEIQARQHEQITQILQQLIRSQNVSASQSDSTEIEVKSIIKNFKCEKYDSNTAAETFIDYFEAQCRMRGLENKPDNVNFLNAKLTLTLNDKRTKKFLSLFQIKTTRFKALTNFWNCTREKHQTFENYANKLKEIAQYCGYEGEMLDRQLRDRFATGLNHKRLEIELKQKWPDLKTVIDNNEREVPFVQVFAVAQAREAAEKDYYDENDTNVHKIKTKNTYENKRKSQIFILNNKQCKRCGKFKHLNNSCAAFSHTCKECNKKGHFEKLCIKTGKAKQLSTANQSKPKSSSTDRRVHKMKSDDSDNEYEEIFNTSSTSRGKKINLLVNNVNCTMDWDPGASYQHIISSEMWEKIGKPFLTNPPKLKAYVVIDNADPMLFGLSWSEAFGMPFPKQVYSISANELVKDTLDTNKQLEQIIENVELFNCSLGKIKNYKVKLHIKENAKPIHIAARPIKFGLHIKENAKPIHIAARPIKFGIQKNVEAELERLVKQGTISPVDPNKTPIEWATPTVNMHIPLFDQLRTQLGNGLTYSKIDLKDAYLQFEELGNGLTYSKIDLKDAYLQFEVEEASRKYLIISTHKGYFQYNRLPFGIVNAPALFCRYIENLLNGIDNVAVYFDDIAITGPTNKNHLDNLKEVFKRLRSMGLRVQHLDNLKEVFKRLRSMGLRVQLNKCTFMKPTIENVHL
ncbi:Reverse transcriptase (RNA-dependent DNA polymerase) [Popillia japonica]|uniref:Reverse transcriptase (RNA-dependent DNA polymerase) n=1 Tax=Popillia japonica TaxID=7064 RepID=A0AAW1IBB7_POPJA